MIGVRRWQTSVVTARAIAAGEVPPPIVIAAVAVTVGVALAGWLPVVPLAGVAGAAGAAALALALRRRVVSLAALALVCLIVGALRAEAVRTPSIDDISRANGQQTVVHGVVADLGDRREKFQRHVIAVTGLGEPASPASGRLQVDLGPAERLLPGEVIILRGRLEAPPSFAGFDYRAVLERQGIRSTMRFPEVTRTGERSGAPLVAELAALREHLRDSLGRSLPQPQAAIAAGLVIGGREDLPAALREAFARTGTSHLLAVSGYNMMLVAAGTLGLLVPLLGRRRAALGAIVAVWLFAGVTATTPAVLRAAVMTSLGLVGLLFGRQRSGLLLLAIAVAGMALATPSVIDDVGFQLSVAATAGLLLVASRLDGWLRRVALFRLSWLAPLREATASTTAAVVATLPIVVLTFGMVSVVATPVNVLAAPLIAPAMATAALCSVAGLLSPPLGQLLAPPAWLFTSALAALVEMAAALPGAAVEVAAPPAEIVALVYFAAGLALLAPVRRAVVTGLHTGGGRGLAFLALAVLAAVMSWAAVLATREGEAAIAIVEDGAVARTPGGRTIVVDGGRNAGPLLAELDRLLPIWDRRVDLYVATAWRPEQGGALNDVVRRVPVDRVAGPPLPEDDRRWAALMSERQLALTVIDRPTDVALGDGSHLWLEPAAALAVRLALPSATVALSEAGRRRGASIGVAKEGGTPPVVAIGGTRYAIARHGAVRLVFGPELRVYLDRP